MGFIYKIGKLLLVLSFMFAAYNEIQDVDFISKEYERSFQMMGKYINKDIENYTYLHNDIRLAAGFIKLTASFLVFCDCGFFCFLVALNQIVQFCFLQSLFTLRSNNKNQQKMDILRNVSLIGGLMMIWAVGREKRLQKLKKE